VPEERDLEQGRLGQDADSAPRRLQRQQRIEQHVGVVGDDEDGTVGQAGAGALDAVVDTGRPDGGPYYGAAEDAHS
jgi:hypothetical protein